MVRTASGGRGAASRASGLRRVPFLERKGTEKSFNCGKLYQFATEDNLLI